MEKGKALELQVKEFLESELKHGKLGISGNAAQVYHRKSYYSGDRQSSIKTDVSLEVTRPGATAPFLVWIWECKDYNHLVPVDDLEEFHSKIEQVGVHRTKGTIVSRLGFQRAAITYARSKAIGLARILPDGSVLRLTEAVHETPDEFVEFGLSEQNTEELEFMFYCLTTFGEGATDFSDLFSLEMGAALG